MWAVVLALAILMWIWAAAGLHLVRWGFKKSDASLQLIYLLAVTAVGAVGLLLLPYLVLPGSVLSQGWTREWLEKAQLSSVLLVGLAAVIGFLRAQSLLLPAKPVRSPVKKTSVKKKA